jgi:hypothetical protein
MLPNPSYFLERLSSTVFEEATTDPIEVNSGKTWARLKIPDPSVAHAVSG